MQLVEIVKRVLETGELPMSLERQMQTLIQGRDLNNAEIAAIDQLIEAITSGAIRSVPDKIEQDLPESSNRYTFISDNQLKRHG